MVRFYVNRIKSGKMTLNDVPIRWRDAVRREMEDGA